MNYSVSLIHSINPLFFAILALGLLLMGKSVYTLKSFPELKSKSIKELVVGSVVMIGVLALFIVLPLLSTITITDNQLEVRLSSGFTNLTVSSQDVQSAVVITLNSDPATTIADKIVGTSSRDYLEGMFQMEDGTEAGILLNGDQALMVKTAEQTLFLGPDDFDDFLADFNSTIFPVE
ncbi:PH domain-containing protein [Eubacteriaceae bacterium ES3]|nr:PH domain-containing protein [Eubacteriaceae bacterium ES3]